MDKNIITAVTHNEPAIVQEQSQCQFLPTWKQIAHEKQLTRYDMAFYCLSKSLRLKGDALEMAKSQLRKSFSPVTKEIKLANGAKPYGTLYDALSALRKPLLTLTEHPDMYNLNYGGSTWIKKDLLMSLPKDELLQIRSLIDQLLTGGYGEVTLS